MWHRTYKDFVLIIMNYKTSEWLAIKKGELALLIGL